MSHYRKLGWVVVGFVFTALTLGASAQNAQAEDLIMPFACAMRGNTVQVTPSNETPYRIVGRREEQPFVHCPKGGARCETMMVHRFNIECDGSAVAWTRIAAAAVGHGIPLPASLPNGFAPVSSLSGRFVLPALTRTTPHSITRVATQDLSPDSVVDTVYDDAQSQKSPWVTEVRADVLRSVPGSNAARVAGSLAGVLAMLLAVSMVAAGRWRLPRLEFVQWPLVALGWREHVGRWVERARAGVQHLTETLERRWQAAGDDMPGDELVNALATLNARLLDVEISISALGPDLLLRDVLGAEVHTIRVRTRELERNVTRTAPRKSAAIIRNLLRDLDRISRIAQSAQQPSMHERTETHDGDMPQTMTDAYRVLGVNPDAAPAVAKKLVDALRMSWHPDHARDETDRLRRENRMKQINAAWDLIKVQRMAA